MRSSNYMFDRARMLSLIAQVQAQAGDIQGATRCISRALTAARSVRDANARVGALGLIGQAQAIAGDAQGATRSFSEALAIARDIADAFQRASALSHIAQAQVQAAKNRPSPKLAGATKTSTRTTAARGFIEYSPRHRIESAAGRLSVRRATRCPTECDDRIRRRVDQRPIL